MSDHASRIQSVREARDARRRRILARSSERLAYITGECKVTPSSSPPRGPVLTDGSAEEAHKSYLSHSLEFGQEVVDRSREPNSTGIWEETASKKIYPGELSLEARPRELSEPGNTQPEIGGDYCEDEISSPSFLPNLVATGLDAHVGFQSLGSIESCKESPRNQTQWYRSSFVRRLSRSIDDTEGPRMICAACIALLLVCRTTLLHCGHRWGNAYSPRWPISVVFVTDFTLAAGALFSGRVAKEEERDYEEAKGSRDGSAVKALDVASKVGDVVSMVMLCKKMVAAVSLDCSIYVAVLACGLSLAKYWFSPSCSFSSP